MLKSRTEHEPLSIVFRHGKVSLSHVTRFSQLDYRALKYKYMAMLFLSLNYMFQINTYITWNEKLSPRNTNNNQVRQSQEMLGER